MSGATVQGLPEAVLETPRLILSPLAPADVPELTAASQDPETQRWLPVPRPYTEDVAREWIERRAPADRAAGTRAEFAVRERDGGRLVATCGLVRVDLRHGNGEVGYQVAAWARGRGYAAEVARALADWGFVLGLQRVELRSATTNVASLRTALRADFGYEAMLRSASVTGEGRTDVALFSRLAGVDPTPPLLPPLGSLEGTLSDGVVTVRPMRADDAEGLYAERCDDEHTRWSVPPAPYTRERAAEDSALAAFRWVSGSRAELVALDAATGAHAGSVQLRMTMPEIGVGEIGYGVAPAWRGRGVARRAIRLATDWALGPVGLARVQCGVDPANVASLRAAEAAGFVREGVQRSFLPSSHGRRDDVLLARVR